MRIIVWAPLKDFGVPCGLIPRRFRVVKLVFSHIRIGCSFKGRPVVPSREVSSFLLGRLEPSYPA